MAWIDELPAEGDDGRGSGGGGPLRRPRLAARRLQQPGGAREGPRRPRGRSCATSRCRTCSRSGPRTTSTPRYESSFRHRSLFTGPNVRAGRERGPRGLGARLPLRDPGPDPLGRHSGRRRLHPHLAAGRARLLLVRRRRRVHEGGRRDGAHGRRAREPADAALARRRVHPRLAPHPRGRDRPADRRAAAVHRGRRGGARDRQERRRPDRERLDAADGHRRDPRRRPALPEGEAGPRGPHRDVLGRRRGAVRGGRRHRARRRRCTGARSSRRSCSAPRRPSTSSTTTRSSSSTRPTTSTTRS